MGHVLTDSTRSTVFDTIPGPAETVPFLLSRTSIGCIGTAPGAPMFIGCEELQKIANEELAGFQTCPYGCASNTVIESGNCLISLCISLRIALTGAKYILLIKGDKSNGHLILLPPLTVLKLMGSWDALSAILHLFPYLSLL